MNPPLIPEDWSPEQALAVYDFLTDLQQRIWDRYELALYALLRPDPDQPDLDDEPLDLLIPEDEIPF
jgi:hypothetical protein